MEEAKKHRDSLLNPVRKYYIKDRKDHIKKLLAEKKDGVLVLFLSQEHPEIQERLSDFLIYGRMDSKITDERMKKYLNYGFRYLARLKKLKEKPNA